MKRFLVLQLIMMIYYVNLCFTPRCHRTEIVTTFDIRTKLPNREPVMNTAEIHTIEHLAATFLRNHETAADQTIYFGPMGCISGFYLFKGDLNQKRL